MINVKTAGNLLWIVSELQAGTANYLLFGNQYYNSKIAPPINIVAKCPETSGSDPEFDAMSHFFTR